MIKKFSIAFFIFFSSLVYSQNQESTIKVNQIGYLKGSKKYAWVNDLKTSGQKWYIKKSSDNSIVFTSTISNLGVYDESSAEKVLRLDFSEFDHYGNYYIEIENIGKSFQFAISGFCYNEVFKAAVKAYYYQRSGIELTKEYAGIWAKPASHTKDAYLYQGFENEKIIAGDFKNCNGGWYDAGDFGKKIVPASIALYPFLKLAEYYPEKVKAAKINIPNPYKGLPDLLAEAKWELDWFLTMQETSGAVYHLIATPEFYIGPAQDDTQTRFIVEISATATADFAAIMALSSKIYKEYLPSFADSCLQASEKAWQYLKQHPDIFPSGGYSDPKGLNGTGAYGDTNDKDERLWAAAELYNTTGIKEYRNYFEQQQTQFGVYSPGGWTDPHNYAMYTYVLATAAEKNNKIANAIKQMAINYADDTKKKTNTNGYGLAISKDWYFWGSNSAVLNFGMEMLIINKITGTENYTEVALNHLNYILGCNSLNLCFVSGLGTKTVKDPHQCINSYDNLIEAPPGFVPGGPNQYIDQWDKILYDYVKTNNLPPAKCYIDNHWSFSSNEVCVVYNSGLVFLSGFFFNPDTSKTDNKKVTGVDITPKATVLIGATLKLTAAVTPGDATNAKVSWTSSDTIVAKINSEGLITGYSAGTTIITVKTDDGQKTASCLVTVNSNDSHVEQIIISSTSINLDISQTKQLKISILPENANNKTVIWSSSNNSVASVSSDGLVTALSEGFAKVSVTSQDGNKTASCQIIVDKKTGIDKAIDDNDNLVNLKTYPNPNTGYTIISFILKENCKVDLNLYNSTGQKIMTAKGKICLKGVNEIDLKTNGLNSGTYICILSTQNKSKQIKIILN